MQKEGRHNMADLNLTMKLLTTSSRLGQASVSLDKMALGQAIDKADKEVLKWAGMFLSAMDRGAKANNSIQDGGRLAVEATSIRPTFYSCLFRIAPKLKEANISSEQQVIAFLLKLYRNLIFHGSPGRGFKKLTRQESGLGMLLLQEIAESILVQINNNGHPKPTAIIKEDWHPTPKTYVAVPAG